MVLALSYFNNYNAEGPANGTHPSNGLELQLALSPDPSNLNSVTVLQHIETAAEPQYADSQGSHTYLSNGNGFMGYGQIPVPREWAQDSQTATVAWEARFGEDTVVQNYRGFKDEWHATPSEKPSLYVEGGSWGCGTAYASRNGATDFEGWAV